jgi:hypothetical protein
LQCNARKVKREKRKGRDSKNKLGIVCNLKKFSIKTNYICVQPERDDIDNDMQKTGRSG